MNIFKDNSIQDVNLVFNAQGCHYFKWALANEDFLEDGCKFQRSASRCANYTILSLTDFKVVGLLVRVKIWELLNSHPMSLFLPIHSLTWVVSTSQGSSSTNTAVSSPTRASNLSSFFGPVARGCLCIQDVNLVFNAPSGVVAQKIKPRRMTGGTMILQAFALVASLLVTKFILINKKKSSQEHKSGSHSIEISAGFWRWLHWNVHNFCHHTGHCHFVPQSV